MRMLLVEQYVFGTLHVIKLHKKWSFPLKISLVNMTIKVHLWQVFLINDDKILSSLIDL